MDMKVVFDYMAQASDELTLKIGDIIKNANQVEDGWMEGDLNGKHGVFPDNFVEKMETPALPPDPVVTRRPQAEKANKQRRAKVRYSYHPQAEDELELLDGQEVVVLNEEEDGWWRGRAGNKEGVFPSNFVEEVFDDPAPTSASSNNAAPTPVIPLVDRPPMPTPAQEPPSQPAHPPGVMMPGIMQGMNPADLRSKLRKTDHTAAEKKPPPTVPPASSPKLPKKAVAPPVHPPQPTPPAAASSGMQRIGKVTFDYEAVHEDELTIKVGEVVDIVSDEDPGWVKAKLRGKVGLIPDNFIDIQTKEVPAKSPALPPPPSTHKPTPEKEPAHPPIQPKKPPAPVPGGGAGKPPPRTAMKPARVPDKDIDLDVVPKTQPLSNDAVTTRPKMTHNPPSKGHLLKGTEKPEEPEEKAQEETAPWQKELRSRTKTSSITRPKPTPPQPTPAPKQPIVPLSKPETPVAPPSSTATPSATVAAASTSAASKPTSAPAAASSAAIDELKQTIADMRAEHKKEMEELKKQIAQLRAEYKADLDTLTNDLDTERKKFAGIGIDVDRLKKSVR